MALKDVSVYQTGKVYWNMLLSCIMENVRFSVFRDMDMDMDILAFAALILTIYLSILEYLFDVVIFKKMDCNIKTLHW